MTDPHVDPEVLADLQEGLLDPPAAAATEAHLVGCPACRGELAALDAVRDELAAAGPGGPRPDDLAQRLDQALAVAATEPGSTAASPTVIPLRSPQRDTPRGMRLLQAAAALVLVFAGGALAVSALDGLGGSSSQDSAGGAASDAAAPKATAGFPVSASGRDWTAATLRAAAPRLATGDLVPTATSGFGAEDSTASPEASGGTARELAEAPAGRLAGGPALASCAAQLAGAPVTPVAVDLASYEGQPAAVLLLPTTDDPTSLDLFVVQPACPPGSFLYFARVPRP
jgi:hypothetical protein